MHQKIYFTMKSLLEITFHSIVCGIVLSLSIDCLPILQRPSKTVRTIVGGALSRGEDVQAYQVSIQTIGGQHFCGGVIVGDEWVVTAAHCIVSYIASSIKIRYDTLTYNQGGTISKVSRLILHPQFDELTSDNDIALIQTSSKLLVNPNSVIHLPSPGVDQPIPYSNITVSGWGYLSENSTTVTTQLQSVTIPVIELKDCANVYGINAITGNMFCAGFMDSGGKDACKGDSGGAAVQQESQNNKKRTLVGLVSWGYACARPGYPGVYTKVANYVDWIMENGVKINY